MSNKIRIAAMLVACSAVGCVSSNEMTPVNGAAAETRLVFGDMHAAIPASKGNGNVFEY